MWLVQKVKTKDWDLIVYFSDGVVKKIDIRDYLEEVDSPTAKKICTDIQFFHKVKNEDGVSLTWPNGYCIDPDYIHEEGQDYKLAVSTASLLRDLKKVIE